MPATLATLKLRAIVAGTIGRLAIAAIAQAVSIDVGSSSGPVGSTVSVAVTLTTGGAEVGGITNVLTSDSAFVGCSVGPNLGISSLLLQPQGCTPGSDCQQVGAVITGPINGSLQPIPDGSVLYTCDVKITGGSVGQVFHLTCSEPAAASLNGTDLPGTTCQNGAILVTNAVSATPTATPGPGTGGGTCAVTPAPGDARIWLLSLPALLFLWWRGRRGGRYPFFG